MFLQLSWRNIWRNKKRTIIAASSVFFAVILAIFMRSGQLGSYEYMIHSSAKMFSGYFQIQGDKYWDDRSLDESFKIPDSLYRLMINTENVQSINPRLETFALVSHGKETKVSQIIGVDPESESRMTELDKHLIKGEYLQKGKQGLVMGAGLARMLDAGIGDSVIIYGIGYHGIPAAALEPITGIVELPFPALNNGTVFLELSSAQKIYYTGDRVTSLSFMIDKTAHQSQTVELIEAILPEKLTIMTWDEMFPELKQNIEFDNIGGIIMLLILYVVIAFGVFGTIMMMTQERAREFAILVSVGMQKANLMLVTLYESLMVSLLGALVGCIGAIPLVHYFYHNPIVLTGDAAEAYVKLGIEPIMTFTTDYTLFTVQGSVVLIIALLSAIYPVFYIRSLDPSKAIRG